MFWTFLITASLSIGAAVATALNTERGEGSRLVLWGLLTEPRHSADLWFRKQADLMRSLFLTFEGREQLCADLDAFVSDISTRNDLQDRHVQMIAQVFEYVRHEYSSGNILMERDMLLTLLVSELDFHVGLDNWIVSIPHIAELFRVTRLRNRALSTLEPKRQKYLTSFHARATWLKVFNRNTESLEFSTYRDSLEAIIEAAEILTLEHSVDIRETFVPFSILYMYEGNSPGMEHEAIRVMYMRRFVSYIGNEDAIDLAVTWGHILSDPRHRLISTGSQTIFSLVPPLIHLCVEEAVEACSALEELGPYVVAILDRSRAFMHPVNAALRKTYNDVIENLSKFLAQRYPVRCTAIALIQTAMKSLNDLPRDLIALHATDSVLLALISWDSASDIRLRKLMAQIIGPELDKDLRALHFAIAKSVIATPRTEMDNIWIDRIFARWTVHRRTDYLLFELAKWAGLKPLKIFSSEIKMRNIDADLYRKVISNLLVASDLSAYSEPNLNEFRLTNRNVVGDIDKSDFGLYDKIWRNAFSLAMGQVTGSAEPIDGFFDFLFQLVDVIKNFESSPHWSAIAGPLPEVVFKYPSNALGNQMARYRNWYSTKRNLDLVMEYKQLFGEPIPTMIIDVYNPYPEVIRDLTLKVEEVYKENIGRALALMKAFNRLMKDTPLIHALTGLPRTTLYAMTGSNSRTYKKPLLETAESYMNLFRAIPDDHTRVSQDCIKLLTATLTQYTETTLNIAFGIPVSLESLRGISTAFNEIASSWVPPSDPAEITL